MVRKELKYNLIEKKFVLLKLHETFTKKYKLNV